MTFDDDFLQLEFDHGTRRVYCKAAGIEWPPPERIEVAGVRFERISMSELTDDERAEMDFLMRGAAYEPTEDQPVQAVTAPH